MSLWWQWQNIDQAVNSQQTPHISPSQTSYGVSAVRMLEIIDHIIAAQHCSSVQYKMQSFHFKYPSQTALWVSYGVSFVSSKYDLCLTFATVALYAILYHNLLCYTNKGSWQCYLFCHTLSAPKRDILGSSVLCDVVSKCTMAVHLFAISCST